MNLADFPLTTATTEEVLTRLIEECAEVIQATTKIKRFGPFNYDPATGISNQMKLASEINDVLTVVAELRMRGVVSA